ncbi:MAG TPA: diguanylate cyclase [Desulfuromonadaceae bacterium]|jgi:diguanylate cyclase (GGDEF)-like protein
MSRILIVDDSPINLKIISGLLGKEYESIVAGDGRTAIKLATEKNPDLILLDVLMPEMDGLAVCKFIKSQPSTAEIPVIFITVVSSPKDIVKAFEAGGQDYITKPFSSMELCARIKTHLDLKESKEALKIYARQLEEKNRELNETLVKLEVMATTDYLTNLPNRRYTMQRLHDEVARLKRNSGDMAIILADIKDFKRINDAYGHDCGDVVLKEIARIMKANTREQDVVARWGGDEFLLVLPDTDLNGGRVVAEKTRQALEAAVIRCEANELSVTVTFGVVQFDLQLDIDANIKQADEALYHIKRGFGKPEC